MQNFISTVTITGIDLYSNLSRLEALQTRFPFVEWGVLLSKTKEGKDNRYPPTEWVTDLIAAPLHVSGHVCGLWARDVAEGGDMFVRERRELGWLELFRRVQLNVSHVLEDIRMPYEGFHRAIAKIKPRVIVQVKNLHPAVLAPILHDVDFLFDCSGGRGVLPEAWPTPVHAPSHNERTLLPNCGYAGGLNPDNLPGQLPLMLAAAEGQPVWIDVESGVRTSDVLDLDKVERFLEAAQPYVLNGTFSNAGSTAAPPNPAGGTTPAV